MNKKIYKYPIKNIDDQFIDVPAGFKMLTVQKQGSGIDRLMLWALVDNDSPLKRVKISVFGTGCSIPDDAGSYIDTVQVGPMVWHVFYS